ncbi:hypothetical protein O181_121917 [Austropuccinia psidii MF-1]|uniref:Uncharacterized protein n=1 Tax=Austropuccinia psidii MF-1 TaxID=1389203 RepID=A0A9Q3Q3W2_9BASI|nr:hypothetical protein [Austropuccinia psidii MF-1]
MRPRGQPIGPQCQVGPPERQVSRNHRLAINTHGLWKPSAQVKKHFPSIQWETFSSVTDPELQEPGLWHIWYYIPLCTSFPQKYNGDGFRTPLGDFKSSPQIHHSTLKEGFRQPVFQFIVALRRPFEDTNHLVMSFQH